MRRSGGLAALGRLAAEPLLSQELLYQLRGSGAFRRFNDAIHCEGIAQDWYRFRTAALREIAEDWLKTNHIPYSQDGD